MRGLGIRRETAYYFIRYTYLEGGQNEYVDGAVNILVGSFQPDGKKNEAQVVDGQSITSVKYYKIYTQQPVTREEAVEAGVPVEALPTLTTTFYVYYKNNWCEELVVNDNSMNTRGSKHYMYRVKTADVGVGGITPPVDITELPELGDVGRYERVVRHLNVLTPLVIERLGV